MAIFCLHFDVYVLRIVKTKMADIASKTEKVRHVLYTKQIQNLLVATYDLYKYLTS